MHILLADDHAMFRSGLRRILEEEFSGAHIEDASSCTEALDKIKKEKWDLVILDIAMGAQNSLTLLPDIKSLWPNMPVLMLSMYNERQFITRALQTGASGYLTKEHAPEELIRAIRSVLAGRRYISESIAEQIADYLAVGGSQNPHESLSAREYEVFLLIAAGKSISDIAGDIGLSVKTVSTYRSRILEKMQMRSNAEIIRYALQNNLAR